MHHTNSIEDLGQPSTQPSHGRMNPLEEIGEHYLANHVDDLFLALSVSDDLGQPSTQPSHGRMNPLEEIGEHNLANHVDDLFLALSVSGDLLAFSIEEFLAPVADEIYARELQLQEALISTIAATPSNSEPQPPQKPREEGLTDDKGKGAAIAEAFCTICMETKSLSELFKVKNCHHAFCSRCINGYVEAKVEENLVSIKCPDPSCQDGFLEPEMCRPLLREKVFDQWGLSLCESAIHGSGKFYCPYKDCSVLLINENREAVMEAECPHCHRLFCANCQVSWHPGFSCEAYQRLQPDERASEDLILMEVAKNSKWQRCPSCRYYVERNEGCMFISCRCGFCFCYGCATQMTADHYCAKCGR